MKRIEMFEKTEKRIDSREIRIKGMAYRAYQRSKEAGNELLDFNEVIFDGDAEGIAGFLKSNGIGEFTISNQASGLISTLAEFQKHGCVMAGLAETKTGLKDRRTGKIETIPAILMKLC